MDPPTPAAYSHSVSSQTTPPLLPGLLSVSRWAKLSQGGRGRDHGVSWKEFMDEDIPKKSVVSHSAMSPWR